MCLGWFAAAAGRGLRHHLGRGVDSIRVEAGRAVGLETADGFVPAARIVLATGAWANDLLRPLGAEQPIELRRLQVLVGRTAPGGPVPSAVCSDAVTNVVVRPDRGRQFCAVAYAGEDLLERADDCDHGLSAGYEDAVRQGLRERYPRLAGFELVRASQVRMTSRRTGTRSSARAPGSRASTLPWAGADTGSSSPRRSARLWPRKSPAGGRRSTSTSCGRSGSPTVGCCRSPTGPARGLDRQRRPPRRRAPPPPPLRRPAA